VAGLGPVGGAKRRDFRDRATRSLPRLPRSLEVFEDRVESEGARAAGCEERPDGVVSVAKRSTDRLDCGACRRGVRPASTPPGE